MSVKYKPISHNVPAVVHIITDKSTGFTSAALTRRSEFSPLEHNQSDWYMQVDAAGVTCYVIGRGDRLDQKRVMDVCEAALRLTQPLPKFSAVEPVQRVVARGAEMPADDVGIDFDNDPLWSIQRFHQNILI